MNFIEKNYKYIVIIILLLMLTLEITSSLQESQTIDEGVHLAAGYSYLIKNDFRMNTEHPPLIKELSALPILFYKDKIQSPFEKSAWQNYDQWRFAKDLIYFNGLKVVDTMFFLGRLPIMLLSLLLGFYVFKWSKELFGIKIGLVSLVLFTFAPNIIAHSRYVTTDLALTAFFFITIYYFNKYLKFGKFRDFIYMSFFFAFAQASKFSAIFLLPILIILGIYALYLNRHKYNLPKILKIFFSNLAVLLFITFTIIFVSYGFEVKKPIDDQNVQELYQQQAIILNNNLIDEHSGLERKIIEFTDPNTNSGKKIKHLAENLPIPAYSYFNGFIKLMSHNYYGHMSYLLGNHSNFGWWYYFPVAFLVKTPTTILIFIILLILLFIYKIYKSIIKKNKFRISYNEILILVFPPLFHFLYSLTSHINLGLRHILLIYPFIFVLCGYIFIQIKNRISKIILYLLILFYMASSILIYPNYLAYFNEISGGPNNGTKYLVDSNIDWGQDAKKLKNFMNEKNIDHVCISYFGQAELDYYDIAYWYLPDNDNFTSIENLNCVVAISATSLYSQEAEYSWLYQFQPNTKIGYSIFIYDFRY